MLKRLFLYFLLSYYQGMDTLLGFDTPFVSHLLLIIVSCDKVAIRIDIEWQAKRSLEI